ncbi:uncharacterized protein F4807DRAFT_439883 [Annulohypoxylon truncatum]|uniref:uncharacterized protein n=1 Tax=Annulohypoxylon truncatum TaxID=327061 RepID=UPI002008A351|nr:uncharacterized protein F4807DRAFT_439883 [Annulohypoxylon truncatum]KAI1206112.1 hypothetical protein F4807DRAFT_439883 [Annulohypoxylon truncatum]
MESLPVELLIQIFSSFCFHCQNPGVFPNADLENERNDKKVLARLCRTSKFICSVAQPILYHCYATGNSRVRKEIDDRVGFPNKLDFLPQFVRTIVQRPDLAAQVTTMHIVRTDMLAGYETHMRTIEPLIEFSISRNLLRKPSLPDDWLDGHFSKWRLGQAESLHRWLVTLAIVLSPRLESLYLTIDTNARFFALEDSPHLKLLSLRTLAMVGHVLDYHFNELEGLYAAAPNLETIYACEASGWIARVVYDRDYKLPLPNVKRLAISDLILDDLGNLLRCTPKLEDLEYYWDDLDEGKEYGFRVLAGVLEPVKATLKRLCIGFLPRSVHLDPFPKLVEPPVIHYPPIETLREFPRLEYLSIDCFLLYQEEDRDTANRLIDLLPPSIRFLRISYVYRGIGRCLRQLAIDAPQKFPLLEEVVLGISAKTNPSNDSEIESSIAVGSIFEDLGIKFSIKYDLLGAHSRTIIPGDIIGTLVTPVPRVLDEVGYEEWARWN